MPVACYRLPIGEETRRELWIGSAVEEQVLCARETGLGSKLKAHEGSESALSIRVDKPGD